MFKNAEAILKQIQSMYYPDTEGNQLKTIYMIGDNPAVDINGAQQVCCLAVFYLSTYFAVHFDFLNSYQLKFLVLPSKSCGGITYRILLSGRTSLVFHFNEDGCFQGKRK